MVQVHRDDSVYQEVKLGKVHASCSLIMEEKICLSGASGGFSAKNQGQAIFQGKIHIVDSNVNFTALKFRINEFAVVN